MENFIKNLEIKHFKSIEHLAIDCKRVNVFIGKPNVGKSNILEAMALLGGGFAQYYGKNPFFLKEFIRYEAISNLFYNDNIEQDIEVISNNLKSKIALNTQYKYYYYSLGINGNQTGLNNHLANHRIYLDGTYEFEYLKVESSEHRIFKKYDFKGLTKFENLFREYLFPAGGDNLFAIIDKLQDLRKEVAQIFKEYGLQFVLSKADKTFELQKNEDDYVYKYPYSSTADTFQRFIFYLAAIESNTDSVLIFEEPEVHSFPPYTKELADRIVLKDDNQYFISTHSPYLLHTLIESLDYQDINVFLTYFEDYETHVKKLSEDDLREILDFSIDVFFNLDKFLKKA